MDEKVKKPIAVGASAGANCCTIIRLMSKEKYSAPLIFSLAPT